MPACRYCKAIRGPTVCLPHQLATDSAQWYLGTLDTGFARHTNATCAIVSGSAMPGLSCSRIVGGPAR